jgi:FKBP-type peptidyl-prolyl cis-trans isomerase
LRRAKDNETIVGMTHSFAVVRNILACGAILLVGALTFAQTTPPKAKPATPAATPAAAPDAPKPKEGAAAAAVFPKFEDRFSYALGMNLGMQLHRQSVDVDPNLLIEGLKDALAGGKTKLTEEEVRATFTEMQAAVTKKQQEKTAAMGEANKKEGAEFLAANKTKPGVVTLPSGLQYKIITTGTGPKPTTADSVVCNYKGTLINGKEFDSSYKRGQPATFPVTGVIKGWTEALQLMTVGSKWELFVPADLAYGEQQRGPDITPNSTLIFEVELMSIQEKPKAPEAPAGDKK